MREFFVDEKTTRNVLTLNVPRDVVLTEDGSLISTEGLPSMDLATLEDATDNFSNSKLLGQGGFGAVYEVNYHLHNSQICNILGFINSRGEQIVDQSAPKKFVCLVRTGLKFRVIFCA